MRKPSQAAVRQRQLDERHRHYYDFNQREGATSRFMADHGHPQTEEYRVLRSTFDRLRYACNAASRYVAYRDETEYVSYDAPQLAVTWRPQGFAGFYDIYPAHRHWDDYLEACVAAGWPAQVVPTLKAGTIALATHNADLMVDIFRIMKARWAVRVPEDGAPYTQSVRGSYAQTLAVLAAVRRRLRRWVLPDRTVVDDVADRIPLDIPNRRFSLAGVEQVTLTDHAVLVPLIPCDERGAERAAEVATALINLCRAHGYPWIGAVRDWCAKFLVAAAIRRLDREFAAQHAAVDGRAKT